MHEDRRGQTRAADAIFTSQVTSANMHKYLDEYAPVSPDRVGGALEQFPYKKISAEEYAAREYHKWYCFGFDSYIYEDSELNEWIHTLGDIFFTPGAVKDTREKHLSTEEIAKIEETEREECEDFWIGATSSYQAYKVAPLMRAACEGICAWN